MADITVITPSLPSRSRMLAEACASVAAQTLQPAAHLIGIDHAGHGPAVVRNQLIRGCSTEWLAFLDDDDLLDSNHLALLDSMSAGRDVVGSYCRFVGDTIPEQYCNRPYDRDTLRQHGIFPITVLARRTSVLEAGCFGRERYEDFALWNRMADKGARIHIMPIISWTYRLGHGNRTFGTAA